MKPVLASVPLALALALVGCERGAPESSSAPPKYHTSTLSAAGATYTLRVDTATGAGRLVALGSDVPLTFGPPPGSTPGPPGTYTGSLSGGGGVGISIIDSRTGTAWLTGDGREWTKLPR